MAQLAKRLGPAPEIIAAGVEAYDAGYRLLASWQNQTLERIGVPVRVTAKPPEPDVTLEQCRCALSNALIGFRAYAGDLPPDSELMPWFLYRQPADDKVYGAAIRLSQESSIRNLNVTEDKYWQSEILRIYALKVHSYSVDDWQSFVIEPVHQQADS